MNYCSKTDIVNLIDVVNLNAMLDDYGQGVAGQTAQDAQLDNIIAMASNKCDAMVSSIYPVPFASAPAKIKDATIVFTCFALHQRRLTPTEHNPMRAQQDYWVDTLTKIGSGDLPLDEKFNRGFPPIVYSVKKSAVNDNIF